MSISKKQVLLPLCIMLLIPACGGRKQKKDMHKRPQKMMQKEVDIPVAEDIRSFFEEDEHDVEDFLLDDVERIVAKNDVLEQVDTTGDVASFSWTEGAADSKQEGFRTVYFDFDGDKIRQDQLDAVDFNAKLIKSKLASNKKYKATIVIDGHACHSAGVPAYNLAISERRARTLRNYLVQAGVPESAIKIVGRGQESPAIINGQKVAGNRKEQWPNRRAEVRFIYA